jgi:hypothetical protein
LIAFSISWFRSVAASGMAPRVDERAPEVDEVENGQRFAEASERPEAKRAP